MNCDLLKNLFHWNDSWTKYQVARNFTSVSRWRNFYCGYQKDHFGNISKKKNYCQNRSLVKKATCWYGTAYRPYLMGAVSLTFMYLMHMKGILGSETDHFPQVFQAYRYPHHHHLCISSWQEIRVRLWLEISSRVIKFEKRTLEATHSRMDGCLSQQSLLSSSSQ